MVLIPISDQWSLAHKSHFYMVFFAATSGNVRIFFGCCSDRIRISIVYSTRRHTEVITNIYSTIPEFVLNMNRIYPARSDFAQRNLKNLAFKLLATY